MFSNCLYHSSILCMYCILHQFKVCHTDGWSGRYNTLPLRSCRRRHATVFCHTLLYHLLHLLVIEQWEGNLVYTQVGSLWRPRHFLECHVGVWVFLQYTHQETTCINRIHGLYTVGEQQNTCEAYWNVNIGSICTLQHWYSRGDVVVSYLRETLHFCTAAQKVPWCASAAWQDWRLLP